jgi:hypothetical protein
MKSRKMKWERYVAGKGKTKNSCRVPVEESKAMRTLGKTRSR